MTEAAQNEVKITEPSVSIGRLIRAAPVWPTSKLCKGGPSAPAFGGCGLDRACRPATVSHHGIDDDVRLMQETTTIQPSQNSLTQNIGYSLRQRDPISCLP